MSEEKWFDAHEPGRPTPPGSTYSILMDFITPELAGAFLASLLLSLGCRVV